MQTTSRVVTIVEKCYQCMSNSFYFWGVVLSRGCIYGWNPAIRKTLYRREKQSEQEGTESSPKEQPIEYILSMLLTSGMSLIWLSQSIGINEKIVSLFTTIGVTLLTSSFLIMVYYSIESKKEQNFAESLYQSLKNIVARPVFTLFLLSLLVLAGLLWIVNPFLFLAVFPGGAIEFIYQGKQKVNLSI